MIYSKTCCNYGVSAELTTANSHLETCKCCWTIQFKYVGCYVFMDSPITYTIVFKIKMKENANDSPILIFLKLPLAGYTRELTCGHTPAAPSAKNNNVKYET